MEIDERPSKLPNYACIKTTKVCLMVAGAFEAERVANRDIRSLHKDLEVVEATEHTEFKRLLEGVP